MKYPVTFRALQEELLTHSQKGRSDALFRIAIELAQFGHLAAHLTHDPKENPIARPYDTKDGEINDAGHAIVQLLTYVALRDIDLQTAINRALDGLRSDEFIKKEMPAGEQIRGICACAGPNPVLGFAFVDPFLKNIENMPQGSILVANHPTSDISRHQSKCTAIITDNGGFSCHAGIIAREHNFSCLVGTGNATEKIKTGDIVFLDAGNGIVNIRRNHETI